MQLRLNVPPATRVLLAVLVVISITHQITRQFVGGRPEFFALIPQLTIFYPWVYVTATFAEQNLVTLLIAGATVLYGGKYLERAWGSLEFGKFVLLVTLAPNITATIIYVAWYAVTRDFNRAMAYIQGSIALQAAFLVALKQLVPEHTVTFLKGILKVRVKHFPAIFLAANTLSGFVLGTDTALVLAWAGFLTSWIYLRFYKPQTDLSGTGTGPSMLRGDASEIFAFAYFWPDAVQPPIAAMADGIYNTLVAIKVLKPFSAEEVETGNIQATARGEGGLPSLLDQGGRGGRGGGKREEAERRRALALKALDQRLHAATANKQPQVPPVVPVPQSQETTGQESEQRAEASQS